MTGLLAVAAAQIGMHHVALDRPGPHDRHFDHQVVETARPQPRQHAHLGPALDLKHAHRVGPADHVVDRRILGRNVGQRERPPVMLLDQIETLANRRQHAQGQAIDLEMPSSSRSSLSHWITVRPAMAAFSIGTSSHSGPRVMTMPPTCCDSGAESRSAR